MKPKDLQRMYGSTPVSFQNRVSSTLACARVEQTEPPRRRVTLRAALATALALALMASLAAAAFSSHTADLFGWFYGGHMREKLLEGSTDANAQSIRAGDVVYTLEEVTFIDDGLYAVGRLTPASDAVLLIAEDYQPEDAVGYSVYSGADNQATNGAESYADLARSRGAKLLMPTISPEAVGVNGGSMVTLHSYGYSYHPQVDGSIQFMVEIPSGTAVEPGQQYDIRFWLANWEVTPEGEHLRDGSTYTGEEWTVSVHPVPSAAKGGENT